MSNSQKRIREKDLSLEERSDIRFAGGIDSAGVPNKCSHVHKLAMLLAISSDYAISAVRLG